LSHSITGQGAGASPEPTAPTTPAVVLDPFSGTGTTLAVAHALPRTRPGMASASTFPSATSAWHRSWCRSNSRLCRGAEGPAG